jgi:hypothetical protein
MHIKRKQKTCYKLIQDLLNCTCILHSQATPSDNLTDSEIPQPHNLWNLHQHILKQSSAPFWVQMDKFSCMNFREVSTCSNFISPLSYGARCGVPTAQVNGSQNKISCPQAIKFPRLSTNWRTVWKDENIKANTTNFHNIPGCTSS